MSILCGTDFSPGTRDAIRVAAALANRLQEPLHLVHAFDPPVSVAWDDDLHTRARAAAAKRLSTEAGEARELGASVVEEVVGDGIADDVLVSRAASQAANLIVLGVAGRRTGPASSLGGTAERVATSAQIPVLLVRGAARIERWLRGEHALKIVVGDDLTPGSEAALRWAAALRRLGPCHLVICHVFRLIGEKSRLGIGGSIYARVPDLEQANLAALKRHAGPIVGAEGVHYRVEATLGRSAEPLLAIASEEAADLMVIGTKRRTGFGRVWHGSSSRVVLGKAPSTVACIPAEEIHGPEATTAVPSLRRVMVTTDLSPIGNEAVGYAYAVVADGGTVHILHVEEERSGQDASVERLRRLIPQNTVGKKVETRLEVLTDPFVASAIAAAAERLDVDVLCMGTHGQSGVARIVLGSVAQAVAERCRRQVLLVPPRRTEP